MKYLLCLIVSSLLGSSVWGDTLYCHHVVVNGTYLGITASGLASFKTSNNNANKNLNINNRTIIFGFANCLVVRK